MSLFEFVTVMVSMILVLTLSGVLGTVSLLLGNHRTVRWHAPLSLWVVVLTICLINHWWALSDVHTLDWNYSAFVYVLIAPLVIAAALIAIMATRFRSAA